MRQITCIPGSRFTCELHLPLVQNPSRVQTVQTPIWARRGDEMSESRTNRASMYVRPKKKSASGCSSHATTRKLQAGTSEHMNAGTQVTTHPNLRSQYRAIPTRADSSTVGRHLHDKGLGRTRHVLEVQCDAQVVAE